MMATASADMPPSPEDAAEPDELFVAEVGAERASVVGAGACVALAAVWLWMRGQSEESFWVRGMFCALATGLFVVLHRAELAELLEEEPIRRGLIDEVLQAAAERRGMTLVLQDPRHEAASS